VTPREIRFAVDGLTGLVVISVAAALANLTWRLAGEAGAPSAVGAAMEAYVAPAPAPDVTGMINLPPFGSAVAAMASAAAPANLVLHGALAAVPANASSALIAAGGQPSASYRIGEAVAGGMVLSAVGVDYVILSLGEQHMVLYFPGDRRAQQAGVIPPGAVIQPGAEASNQGLRDIKTLLPPSLTGRPAPPAPAQPQPQTQPQTQPQPQPQSLPAQNNISGIGLIDSPGATVTRQGYQLGSTVSPQLRAAGLAPGDVIASVNGVSAAALAGDPRRLAQSMGSGNARVEVLRGGNRMILSVPRR
jgi:general secretion pathway protein C